MAVEGRDGQHLPEGREVAVQVADDHHFGGSIERDDAARAPRGRAEQLGRAADGRQELSGSGMASELSGQGRRGRAVGRMSGNGWHVYQFASSAVSQCS